MKIQTVQVDSKPHPPRVRFSDEIELFQVYVRSEEIIGGGVGWRGGQLPLSLQFSLLGAFWQPFGCHMIIHNKLSIYLSSLAKFIILVLLWIWQSGGCVTEY